MVPTLAALLGAMGWQMATVESCTGGGIAAALTAVPGSSSWFERGFVTYSNESKTELVGVPSALILEEGAVSIPVAEAMARGGVEFSRACAAVSVTGIAGPDGGSADKPVGTVCLGWALPRDGTRDDLYVESEVHVFDGDRTAVRAQSVDAAIGGLIRRLQQHPDCKGC